MQKFSKLLWTFKTSDKICIRNKWRMSQHKREEIVFFDLSVIYFLTTKMCDIITVVVWVKLGIPKALPYTFEASKSWIFLTKNVGMFFSQNVGSSHQREISRKAITNLCKCIFEPFQTKLDFLWTSLSKK